MLAFGASMAPYWLRPARRRALRITFNQNLFQSLIYTIMNHWIYWPILSFAPAGRRCSPGFGIVSNLIGCVERAARSHHRINHRPEIGLPGRFTALQMDSGALVGVLIQDGLKTLVFEELVFFGPSFGHPVSVEKQAVAHRQIDFFFFILGGFFKAQRNAGGGAEVFKLAIGVHAIRGVVAGVGIAQGPAAQIILCNEDRHEEILIIVED